MAGHGSGLRTLHSGHPYRHASLCRGPSMQVQQSHPLEPFFQQAVRNSYEGRLGLGPEITGYVAKMLCDFSEPGSLFRLRDAKNRLIERLDDMVKASDPIHGTARSFIAERTIRKYIGDYTLFLAGMCPEAIEPDPNANSIRPTLSELIRVGKESYHIVSQFNVFEYEGEAPLYAQLASVFEHCILGLAIARRDLWRTMNPPTLVN
jgi:hypothetical protein